MRRRLTPEQREQRARARATARAEQQAAREALTKWLERKANVVTPELGTFRGIAADHRTRRALGQRGRPRRPRRRELPAPSAAG